jgi:magnesium-transporting ATPase (P-type)
MKQKPRDRKEHILSNSRRFIILTTIIGRSISLSLFIRELNITNIDKARTIVLTTIIIFELFLAFTIRSDKYNIRELKRNKYLRRGTAISL